MPDGSEQLDQMSPSDTLIDRGVADPLDEGYIAPDHWSPAQGYGNTAAEMRQGESLDQRLAQEESENKDTLEGAWNPLKERRQVGSQRAGRLSGRPGEQGQATADDVGIDGGAASAEEAAMHIIIEDDLASDDDDR